MPALDWEGQGGKGPAIAPGCGSMRTGFFGYEKSKSALTAPSPLFMWGSRRGARPRAAVRAGGNGGAPAASSSAAGDVLLGFMRDFRDIQAALPHKADFVILHKAYLSRRDKPIHMDKNAVNSDSWHFCS